MTSDLNSRGHFHRGANEGIGVEAIAEAQVKQQHLND